MLPIITLKEAEKILSQSEGEVSISLDLGLSLSSLKIEDNLVFFDGQKLSLSEFKKVKEDTCYVIEDNTLKKAAFFSDETNFYYKIVPSSDWPTITLSSTPMHRHTKTSPKQDSESKIAEISPVKGNVLDTCCGLGYTAILSAKNANLVYTFERDKFVLNLASYNPYSIDLFHNKKIKLHEEDVFEGIKKLDSSFFDRVVHDPPTLKYSPELFSADFYCEMFRVMKKGAILYHYCPNPQKTHGAKFYETIIKKLSEAGFKDIKYNENSSGIRAVKK